MCVRVGQGTAWRCADVVLEPLDMAPLAFEWRRACWQISPETGSARGAAASTKR